MNPKQKAAAQKNIQKAKKTWKKMTQGEENSYPGFKGTGEYYRVVIQDEDDYVDFRTHDVGDKGGIQRLAGKRKDGSWDTQAWLIAKNLAHLQGDHLVPDHKDAAEVIGQLNSKPVHIKGDVYLARPK